MFLSSVIHPFLSTGLAPGQPCGNIVNQCVPNAECSATSGSTCQCTSDYYSDGNACLQRAYKPGRFIFYAMQKKRVFDKRAARPETLKDAERQIFIFGANDR